MNQDALETGWAFLGGLFPAVGGTAIAAAGGTLSRMMATVGLTVGVSAAIDWLIQGYDSPEAAEAELQAEMQASMSPLGMGARGYYLGQWDNWAAAAHKHVPEPALSKVVEPSWQKWRKENIEAQDSTLLSYQDAARAMKFLIKRYGSDEGIQASIAKSAKPPIEHLPPGSVGPAGQMWFKKYGVILGLAGAGTLWYAWARRKR